VDVPHHPDAHHHRVIHTHCAPECLGRSSAWRAYLLPKLMPLGARTAVLLVGVIHGACTGRSSRWDTTTGLTIGALRWWRAAVPGDSLFPEHVTGLGHPTQRQRLARRARSRCNQCLDKLDARLQQRCSGSASRPPTGGDHRVAGYALLALLIFFSARALTPTGSPRPVESKVVQEAAHQLTA